MHALLAFHIAVGTVALLGGYVALFTAKRRGVHSKTGTVFTWGTVGVIAAAVGLRIGQGEYLGALEATLSAYLVVTAVRTMRRTTTLNPMLDRALMWYAAVYGVIFTVYGFDVMQNVGGKTAKGVPFVAILLSSIVALLAAYGDRAVLRDGARRGSARLRRHLWRMCIAMFFAAGSLFLGQAHVIPAPLRIWPLLILLSVTPVLMLAFYFVRHRRRSPSGGAASAATAVAP